MAALAVSTSKGRSHGPSPRDEEAHRLRLGNGLERRIHRGQRERVDRKQLFAAQLQRRAAGGQHLQRGAARQQRHHQVGCGIQDMLAVVQEQERVAGGAGRVTSGIADRAIRSSG